jgi:hypothetical protein
MYNEVVIDGEIQGFVRSLLQTSAEQLRERYNYCMIVTVIFVS